MSLHAAAQHLAAHGRGKDTELVHMTPREVKSLQDLARAQGGSLTTNPHTGLPEAGFLEMALPVLAGAALGPAGFGLAETGLGAGLMVGGGTALLTGNLGKGLMAGLGAYGGFGLGEGLSGLGTSEESLGNALNKAGYDMTPEQYRALSEAERMKMISPVDIFGKTAGEAGFQSDLSFTTPQQQTFLDTYKSGMQAPPSFGSIGKGISAAIQDPSQLKYVSPDAGWTGLAKIGAAAAAPAVAPSILQQPGLNVPTTTSAPNPVYKYNRGTASPFPQPDPYGVEQVYFPTAGYVRMAEGGATPYIQGSPAQGSIEHMSNENAVGANTGYPQAGISQGAYATPWQTPISRNMLEGAADTGVNPISGEMNFANGGLSNLGGYSDGGRLLRGPGDGVSDSIPAVIGNKQPARLADGEFVVPARIVSEIGNGSTEAGARKLYAMMDRVQKARAKTTGKGKIAKNTKADRYLPA